MMELCHITAGYGGPPVLRDVSLVFEPGKVTVLAGPNGCGKSTLLRVAARLMAPERGEVRIEGQDVSRLSRQAVCPVGGAASPEPAAARHHGGEPGPPRALPLSGLSPPLLQGGQGGGPPSHGAHRCGRAGGGAHGPPLRWTETEGLSGHGAGPRTPRCCCWTSPPPFWISPTSWSWRRPPDVGGGGKSGGHGPP